MGGLAYIFIVSAMIAGAWFRPASAVAASICMFALDQWGQLSIPWVAARPIFGNALVAAIVALALLRQKTSISAAIARSPPATWMTVALYFYAALSSTWAPVDAHALVKWIPALPYIGVLVLVTPLLINTKEDLRTAVAWTAVVGLAFAALMLYLGNWGSRGLRGVGSSFETNPLAIANFGAFAFIALILGGSGNWKVKDMAWRGLGSLVCVALIVRSGSRGELIGALAAIVLCLPIRFKITSAKGFVAAGVAVAFGVLALNYAFSNYVGAGNSTRWQSGASSGAALGRLASGLHLVSVWAGSPFTMLFGLGNSASYDPKILGYYPHNLPLEILGEEGLVGLALICSLIATAVINGKAVVRAVRDHGPAQASLAFWPAIVIHTFIVASKEGDLLGNVLLFMTFSMLGRAAVALKLDRSASVDSLKWDRNAAPDRPANLLP